MRTVIENSAITTTLSQTDRSALRTIVKAFAPHVSVQPLDGFLTMTRDDLWMALIGQVCVMGAAGAWQRLQQSGESFRKFQTAIALPVVLGQTQRRPYLERTLRRFSATRFPGKAAQKLAQLLRTRTVLRNGAPVLFEGLSRTDDAITIRDTVIARCPIFRLKSASDFMISVGLSDDVIALDSRIVGVLNSCCDYDRAAAGVQANRGIYLSAESALREFTREEGISLALLDRLLFKFSNLSAMEFIAKYAS